MQPTQGSLHDVTDTLTLADATTTLAAGLVADNLLAQVTASGVQLTWLDRETEASRYTETALQRDTMTPMAVDDEDVIGAADGVEGERFVADPMEVTCCARDSGVGEQSGGGKGQTPSTGDMPGLAWKCENDRVVVAAVAEGCVVTALREAQALQVRRACSLQCTGVNQCCSRAFDAETMSSMCRWCLF